MILESPLPQTPANQPQTSPVLPAETAAPSGNAFQSMQQQVSTFIILNRI